MSDAQKPIVHIGTKIVVPRFKEPAKVKAIRADGVVLNFSGSDVLVSRAAIESAATNTPAA